MLYRERKKSRNFKNPDRNNDCLCDLLPENLNFEANLLADKLNKRLIELQPNSRIKMLSMPKHFREKCKPHEIKRRSVKRTIEIVREPVISTRLEQLAMNSVRKLFETKQAYAHILEPWRRERLNRNIRKNLYSLYSRLAKIQPPEMKEKVSKWSDKDWDYHTKKLNMLAKPKEVPIPKPIKRTIKPLSELKRLEFLSTPVRTFQPETPKLDVSEAAKNYKASARIKELSRPIRVHHPKTTRDPFRVRRFAPIKQEVSEHIARLATPREKQTKISDLRENPFQVSPSALKAVTTQNMITLSKPRKYKTPSFTDPFKVSIKALTARTTKKIIKLSKPKKRPEHFFEVKTSNRNFPNSNLNPQNTITGTNQRKSSNVKVLKRM